MEQLEPFGPPTLPDDVNEMLEARKRTRQQDTVIVVMGSTLNITGALEKLAPAKEEREAIDNHIDRWARFERRWKNHPIMGTYAADMRVWEARKAGVDLTATDETFGEVLLNANRDWFFGMLPQTRLAMVKDETGRRVSERRLKLARRKLRDLALPRYHIDAITSLKTA